MKHINIKVNCTKYKCPHHNYCPQILTQIVKFNSTNIINILFVGQGGGASEESTGIPFIGRSGQRLRKIMYHYIIPKHNINYALSNNVRFRPQNNRTPTIEEVNICFPYLIRDINYLKPNIIIGLGKSAFSSLSSIPESNFSVSEYRQVISLNNQFKYPITITYHPSYLIRQSPKFNSKIPSDFDQYFINDIIYSLEQ